MMEPDLDLDFAFAHAVAVAFDEAVEFAIALMDID